MNIFEGKNPSPGVVDAIDVLMEGHKYYKELYRSNNIEIPKEMKQSEVNVKNHRQRWSIFFHYIDPKILSQKGSYTKWANDLIKELREILKPSKDKDREKLLWTLLPIWREYALSQVKVFGIEHRYPIHLRFQFINDFIKATERYLKKIPPWISPDNRKKIRKSVIEVVAEDLYPAWNLLQLGQYTKSDNLDLKSLLLNMEEKNGKLVAIAQGDRKNQSMDPILAITDWRVRVYLNVSEKNQLFKVLMKNFGVEKSMGTRKISPISRLKTYRANLRQKKS